MVHLQSAQEIKAPTIMAEEIKQSFLKIFPHSHFGYVADTKPRQSYSNSLIFEIALGKDKTEFPNGYVENDPMGTKFIIRGFNDDDTPSGKIEVKNLTNYGIYTKPAPDSHLALGKVKVWNGAFTVPADKVVPRLTKYFLALKDAVKANIDNFPNYASYVKAKV